MKPDLCEDQDQQCSIKCKSKWKADRTAKVNFNAIYTFMEDLFARNFPGFFSNSK